MASLGTTLRVLAYRFTSGRVGGASTLLLSTTESKSGRQRTVSLRFARDGQDYVIIGSNGGRDTMPAWYLDLQAQPQAEIQVGGAHVPIAARTVPLQERQRLWELLVAVDPSYEQQIERTKRIMPIVRLSPRAN